MPIVYLFIDLLLILCFLLLLQIHLHHNQKVSVSHFLSFIFYLLYYITSDTTLAININSASNSIFHITFIIINKITHNDSQNDTPSTSAYPSGLHSVNSINRDICNRRRRQQQVFILFNKVFPRFNNNSKDDADDVLSKRDSGPARCCIIRLRF